MTGHKIKHLILQVFRRFTQVFVIIGIVALPYISLYAHYHAAKAVEDIELMSGVNGSVLSYINRQLVSMEDVDGFLAGYKGTLWSMRLHGVDISDPLAAAELIAASRGLYLPFLLSIVIPVILTLVLGRVFCSWICPADLLFEITDKLRGILKFAEIQPADIRFSLNNKYIVLGIGLVAAALICQPFFSFIYPPAVLSRLAHAWIFGTALTGMVVILLLLVAFEVFLSPRWWCRTMCPGGALYALIGWPRLLRVNLKDQHCNRCGECVEVCDAGINPMVDSARIECTNCGECIKTCTPKALYFTVGLPGISKKNPTTASLSFCLTILIILAGIILSPMLCRFAEAHHILGLPHYSYKENYPQVPTLEYPAKSGPYDILLTSYPGKPIPNEAVSLSFYIKNRTTEDPFGLPIKVRVLQTFTFGQSKEIIKPVVCEPFERPRRLSVTFPDDGEYIVELTMEVEGKPEVIPFVLNAGEPSATISVLITVGILLLLFIIIIRAIKIKRARRASTQ